MSIGDNPGTSARGERHTERLMADADAARAARLAGHKSLFRRLLEHLRPQRQAPGGDTDGSYGASDNAGH